MNSFLQVDAFTSQPFGGNTAGVIISESGFNPGLMQKLSTQHNLPATAFVQPEDSGFAIRWYSIKQELALCGHGTLASAHVLFEQGIVKAGNKIHFISGKGDLSASWDAGWITLDFPAYAAVSTEIPDGLKTCFKNNFLAGFKTQDKYLIELTDESAVRNYIPDFSSLAPYKCVVTARGDKGSRYDFVSRYFDGPDGIPEDAVTGSSHCSLAPFWADRLKKNVLHAYQASSRGGELKLVVDHQRVLISGQAVTVVKGTLMI
jgi:predicted PhzF superfamily epimerase YddE/YHI9